MTAGFQLGVIGSLTLSVASSVAIVIWNKALISTLGFPFGKGPIELFSPQAWMVPDEHQGTNHGLSACS